MRLPFTRADFLDVFAAYNSTLWPAVVALWIATVVVLVLLPREHQASRPLSALLAVHWAWSAIAYHLAFFARINPGARLFAGLFLLQAVLFTWFGVVRTRLTFSWGRSPRHVIATSLYLYALAYPVLSLLLGHDWPRAPTFGVPCPTTILTIGLLLAVEPPLSRWLAVIPVTWALIGGSAAFVLGVRTDLMLLPAGAGLALYAIEPRLLARPGAA